MTDRKITGNRGEALAADHLKALGYTLEATNYRYRRTEIDLICRDGDVLVFVEVKTRTSAAFGHPSRFLKPDQESRISGAASSYMDSIGYDWEIRFDLISVLLRPDGGHDLEHIKDAFFPGLH